MELVDELPSSVEETWSSEDLKFDEKEGAESKSAEIPKVEPDEIVKSIEITKTGSYRGNRYRTESDQ